ncbi:MAG: hypothetical protein AUJ92_21555 [Armatimonadetes bacterium CG2_30_59_28]|nr:MAG: hypothetical protein AUJ92_21555 [Armatimonadetes bacterium CG2_30_59_28]PIU64048.1 MAG: hypothetical protein COS85_14150 [Armatimonadetes bacterium CG07_land_8_20_14_0_80_59_28]PIX43893.1 MAG: hypothetical protein COZ56_06105 [Armatimonadetes bacterium CG_4_8_14_3_um_filter_58_9]PIY46935.1 MAG: hypothetical protein COZ05_05575 [Armatimonadetes bacterium CG_4_10_14_3_um_filter_59_10]
MWGWRGIEQFADLQRKDPTFLDAAMKKAKAAKLTSEQKQRLAYFDTYYQLMRISADQYLLAAEMSDPKWVASRKTDDVLRIASQSTSLTASFNRK